MQHVGHTLAVPPPLHPQTHRVTNLQQEVASLRAKVKGAKEKARGYEGQVAGMASVRAELEQQQQAVRSELRSVKAEVRWEGALPMALVAQTWTGTCLLSCMQLVSSSNPFLTLWQLASTEEQLKRETGLRTEAEFLSKSLQRGQ